MLLEKKSPHSFTVMPVILGLDEKLRQQALSLAIKISALEA